MAELRELAAGGFGGACLAAVGAPFDLVKVRQQARHGAGAEAAAPPPSSWRVAEGVVRAEGLRGLWRGVGPPLLTAPPTFAVMTWAYSRNRRLLRAHGGLVVAGSPLCESALAGAAVAPYTALIYTRKPLPASPPCATPVCDRASLIPDVRLAVAAAVERVKCLLQVDGERVAAGQPPRYRGMRECAADVWATRGLGGLYQGLAMTLARDVPAWATYFAVYHEARRALAPATGGAVLDGSAPLSPAATFAAGALAGASTWAVCIPQDTIKTRWQTGRYRSHAHVLRSLLRGPGGGVGRLFRGFWPIVLGGVPRDGACLLGIEAANRAMTLLFGW